jgi:hypothetical protein
MAQRRKTTEGHGVRRVITKLPISYYTLFFFVMKRSKKEAVSRATAL